MDRKHKAEKPKCIVVCDEHHVTATGLLRSLDWGYIPRSVPSVFGCLLGADPFNSQGPTSILPRVRASVDPERTARPGRPCADPFGLRCAAEHEVVAPFWRFGAKHAADAGLVFGRGHYSTRMKSFLTMVPTNPP